MDRFPFELAVFNSDILNDENHIYFDMERVTKGFGFVKFPIEGDVKESIYRACRKLYANASIPSYVLIPFKHYAEIISKETPDDVVQGTNFRTWLAMLSLTPYIMTPDYLKDHVEINSYIIDA